jgi:hypothetical protein
VGSLAAAATLAIVAAAGDAPDMVAGAAVVAALIILHRHLGNVSRIRAGTERRVGQRLVRADDGGAPSIRQRRKY